MISKNPSHFEIQMEKVVKFMELDEYSNNNAEHLINLKDFMKTYYKAIIIYETEKRKGDARMAKCFTMQFENKILKGEFIYHQPKEMKLGLY